MGPGQGISTGTTGRQQPAAEWHGTLPLLGGLGGLLLLGVAGYYAWNTWVVEALRGVDPGALLPSVIFGVVAGAGSFFAPCAISLFPAYVGYYVTAGANLAVPSRSPLRRAAGGGLVCAAGALLFFAAVGVALSALGAAVSRWLIWAKPFLAAGIILAGLALLSDRTWNLPFLGEVFGRVKLSGDSPRARLRGMFLYGFVYALASTGCTLPVYMAVVIFPFLEGHPLAGVATLGGFGAGMGLLMLITTLLVGISHQSLLRRVQAAAPWIKKASGLVLIGAGAYLGYYYLTMGM